LNHKGTLYFSDQQARKIIIFLLLKSDWISWVRYC